MRIDLQSDVPIFLQIVNAIQAKIAAGVYLEGERIPSVKDLAVELHVNPNTVQKAYSELVSVGVVESRRGLGKFVAAKGASSAIENSEVGVTALMHQAIQMGILANLSQARITKLFKDTLALSHSARKTA